MPGLLHSILGFLESIRFSRSGKRYTCQFETQGFKAIAAPPPAELLPLRYPELIRDGSVRLFEKDDTQVLLFSTYFTPRTRLPHRPRMFVLTVMPLGDQPELRSLSAAIREPSEIYSFVDLLNLDTYPSLSPLPDGMIFAADQRSAEHIASIREQHEQIRQRGSLVLHAGRLMYQMPLD